MASEEWPFASTWSLHGNKDIVSRYEILERIGEGTFGEVHRARRREDSLMVALKEIHNSESSSREIGALLLVDHPNVVKLYEYFVQGSNTVLVLEYLPYNLSEVIKPGKGELSDGEVKGWMIQILRGLAACHAASILHRDLKPNNILISEDRTVKIADFGQARILSNVYFVKKGRDLCGSEIHENYVTESEGYSIHQATKFEGDVSVVEGRQGEASGDYFGVGIGRNAAGKGNSSTEATEETIAPVTDFVVSAPRDSDALDRTVSNLGSCPTNVGFSALADAVKDARNYFTMEEMVRNGTGMDGLGLSGLQRQRIMGSHTEDPGCCGWFPTENVDQHRTMTGVRNWSSGNDTMPEGDVLERSVGRDHQGIERGDDFSSGDESDDDWKGKYGIRSEDLIDTPWKTEGKHNLGISSSSTSKGGEGDFLQKFRRFIRKRTRRLNIEGGKIAGGPVHSRTLKEAAHIDGEDTLYMGRSPAGSRKSASTGRNFVNVRSTHFGLHSVPSSQGRELYSQTQNGKSVRNFHGRERKSLKVESSKDDGARLESMDEVSAASGLGNAHTAQQTSTKEGVDLTVPVKSDGEVMKGEEEDGDARTESGRKLYGGLQVEKVERKTTNKVVVLNGPLREMAYVQADETEVTATADQRDFKDNFPTVDEREFISEVGNGSDQTHSIYVEKSKGDHSKFTMKENEIEDGCQDLPFEVLGESNLGVPSIWGAGWKDVDGLGESVNGNWEGGSGGEPIPGNRDVCKSWTQTEGYNSTLSDAEAEGTRWYRAPQFQYSYMDSKRTSHSAGGRANDEIYGRVPGSEEELDEEGSEGGTAYHKNSGDYSQESFERGVNSESEHGSDFTTMVGTRWYKAPELLYGATKYGTGIDIWAVGCIFGELLCSKPLFPGLNDIDQLSRVVRILGSPNEKIWTGISLLPDFNKICFVDERSPLTLRNCLPQISEAALDFLEKLLTYDPVLRLSAETALEDEFFLKQPLPCPCHELPLPTREESEASDEDWGDWKDPGSPFSDFEILG